MAHKPEKTFIGSIVENIKTIFYALLIAGIFRTLFFQPFWIPSGSMKDGLLIGDFLVVNKMAYGYSYASCPKIQISAIGLDLDVDDFCGFIKDRTDRIWGATPERGDVVVFRHPVSGDDYIKRLIGLPGDEIQMISGVLHINGTAVQLQAVDNFVETYNRQGPLGHRPMCREKMAQIDGACTKARYVETMPNGRQYTILKTFDQENQRPPMGIDPDNTKVYNVPEGHFFFMGDNRDNSTDSRIPQIARGVGFVPMKNIIGRADRILFSSSGKSILSFWTWRSGRYFKAVE